MLEFKQRQNEHKGFLYLKCKKCGKERFICAKTPMSYYKCECGERNSFADGMRKVYIHCECGRDARYLTNCKEDMFDIACPTCGNFVPVQYKSKRNVYQSL